MEIKVRARASARIVVEDGGAVVFVRLSGVMGLHECEASLQAARIALQSSPARAVIVDMRCAALTLDRNEYTELLRALLWRPIVLPVAIVADGWVTRVSQVHEQFCARRGLRHRFFPNAEAALKWVSRTRRAPRAPGLFD